MSNQIKAKYLGGLPSYPATFDAEVYFNTDSIILPKIGLTILHSDMVKAYTIQGDSKTSLTDIALKGLLACMTKHFITFITYMTDGKELTIALDFGRNAYRVEQYFTTKVVYGKKVTAQ